MKPLEMAVGQFITRNTLLGVFMVVLAIAAMLTIILFYHWKAYAFQSPLLRRMKILYLAGLTILVLLQLGALASFTP
jgi:hypothetical protein